MKDKYNAMLLGHLVAPEIREALVTLANQMQGMSQTHIAELIEKATRDGRRDRLLQAATEAVVAYTSEAPLTHCEVEVKFRMQGEREKISVTAFNRLRVSTPTQEQIETWMDGILAILAPICGEQFGRRAKYQVQGENNCYLRVAWPPSKL
jgi:hypothetical protein